MFQELHFKHGKSKFLTYARNANSGAEENARFATAVSMFYRSVLYYAIFFRASPFPHGTFPSLLLCWSLTWHTTEQAALCQLLLLEKRVLLEPAEAYSVSL